jgi:hypothetical protein
LQERVEAEEADRVGCCYVRPSPADEPLRALVPAPNGHFRVGFVRESDSWGRNKLV